MAKSKTLRQFSAEWMDRIMNATIGWERRFDSRSQRKRVVADDVTLPDPGSITYSGSCCCNETYSLKARGTKEPLKPLYYKFSMPGFRCGCTDAAETGEFQLHPPEPEEGEEPEENPTVFTSDPIQCIAPKGATIPCVQTTTYTWSAGESEWTDPQNADEDCNCTAPVPEFSGTEDGQPGESECEGTKTADGVNDKADSFWQLTIVPALNEAGGDDTKLEFIVGSTVVYRYYLTRNIGHFRPFCRTNTNSFTITSLCGPSSCEVDPPGLICVTPSIGDLWIEGVSLSCCTRPTIEGEPKLPRFVVLTVSLANGLCDADCCALASGTFVLEWNGSSGWEYKFGICFDDSICGAAEDCGPAVFAHVSLGSWILYCGLNGLELYLSATNWVMAEHPPGEPEVDCECGIPGCYASSSFPLYIRIPIASNPTCFTEEGLLFPTGASGNCNDASEEGYAHVRALTELP